MSIKKGKVKVENDKVIIQEGSEATNELFYLAQGTAIAEVKGKTVGTIKAGEWFGEMAALLGATRTATVRTVTHCEMIVFRGLDDKALIDSMGKDPKMMHKLIQTLAMRLVESSRRGIEAADSSSDTLERYRTAISGTAYALEKICEKYKSKVMQEVKDHLTARSGIPSGWPKDVDLDYFRSCRTVIES